MRHLFRLNVLKGSGRRAEVAGLPRRRQDRHGREGGERPLFRRQAAQCLPRRVPDGRAAISGPGGARRAEVGEAGHRRHRRPERAPDRERHRPPHRARCSASSRGPIDPETIRRWRSPWRNEDTSLSADRRYGPRRLASLFADDVESAGGQRRCPDPRADRRQPRRRARHAVRGAAGHEGGRRAVLPQAVEAGAAAVLAGRQALGERPRSR